MDEVSEYDAEDSNVNEISELKFDEGESVCWGLCL